MHVRRQRLGLRHRALPRGWRHAVASLVLVLFAVQNYVTQTHIHFLRDAPGAGVQAITAGFAANPIPSHNRLPPADNPATCPICLDLALAGHFTTPGAIALALPPLVALPVAITLAVPAFVAAVSHIWQGRAPPQA